MVGPLMIIASPNGRRCCQSFKKNRGWWNWQQGPHDVMGNVQGDESQEFEMPMKTVTRSLPGQW